MTVVSEIFPTYLHKSNVYVIEAGAFYIHFELKSLESCRFPKSVLHRVSSISIVLIEFNCLTAQAQMNPCSTEG